MKDKSFESSNPDDFVEFNRERALVAIVREICANRGIKIASFSDDWILCLQTLEHTAYIFGYDFGLNSATAKMICKDKAATSDLLEFHGLPRVEHRLFHGPQLKNYIESDGSWRAMLALLGEHENGLVCKPNEGTGGRDVFLIRTPAQLERAVYLVFSKSRSLCLSPFETIFDERRVVILRGKVEFIYKKKRPTLTGDGVQTIAQLARERLVGAKDFYKTLQTLDLSAESRLDWEFVPPPGVEVEANWRHNLAQGASPQLLIEGSPEWKATAALAIRTARALEIEAASIDLIETPHGLKVLEINSGIMMESLVKSHPDGWALAKRFYDKLICAVLQMECSGDESN